MRKLPRQAQLFVAMIWLLGGLAVIGAILLPSPPVAAETWELGLFILLGIVAGETKLRLIRHPHVEQAGSITLGFVITFATLLRFGPAAGVLVGAVGTLCSCVFPRRLPVHQLAFNTALIAFSAFFAGVVFLLVNGGTLDLQPVRSFPAVMASCAAFFLIDTGAVATVMALCANQDVSRLWKEKFLWIAPSYLAGACVSTLALVIFDAYVGTVLLYMLPVAYLTYQSYLSYTARAEEKQRRIEGERQHIEELQMSRDRLADLHLATIRSLALAIDAKDQYTHDHILRVQRYAVATAKRMGVTGADLEGVATGALLHDVGKLGVPEYVLLKPGRLTGEEFAKIKKHPEIGAAILDPVEFPWPVLPVVKYHHEKWDGTGYPEGLRGEQIPLTARILAVADVYDALTSSRPYRDAWSHDEAIATIKRDAGAHFDPAVVRAFLEVVEGIVQEMARSGYGPLAAPAHAGKPTESKADQAVRDIRRASSELWTVYEVAQTLSASLGLQETLDILARKLESILPGTACLFLLKGEGDDALVARTAVGVNREFFTGSRTLGGGSKSSEVTASGHTYRGPYQKDDLLLISSPVTEWVDLQSALVVPIVHQGEVLGTVNMYHPQPDAFGPDDQHLLETIAERAAVALYNGIQFDRTRSNAITDPLTGLYNMRYLTQYLEERCRNAALAGGAAKEHIRGEALRKSDKFALLWLDLDSFKAINDLFGHHKGDQVLRDLSKVFRATVRKDDIVARYGGDEFLIVLDNAGAAEAGAVTHKLQAAVAGYDPGLFYPDLGPLRMGVSIGVACFPDEGADGATLLHGAASRMYQRKTVRRLGQLADNDDKRKADMVFARSSPLPPWERGRG